MEFNPWLLKQAGKAGPVGDLGEDATEDRDKLPSGGQEEWRQWLEEQGANELCLAALDMAWQQYMEQVSSRPRPPAPKP
jgi:uncharacterized protein YozE (UPF0346 family)